MALQDAFVTIDNKHLHNSPKKGFFLALRRMLRSW